MRGFNHFFRWLLALSRLRWRACDALLLAVACLALFSGRAFGQVGTVVAWGGNQRGQTNVPAGLTNAIAVAGGTFHSIALRSDGTVVAWGSAFAQTNVAPD